MTTWACLLCGLPQVEWRESERGVPLPHLTAVIVNEVARHGTPQVSVSCSRCGFVQAYPMPTAQELSDYYESGAYRRDFPMLEPHRRPIRARADASWLISKLRLGTGSAVHEVGCGDGTLLVALKARGVSGTGWDPDPGMRKVCASRGIVVTRERVARRLTLLALQVLEHAADPLAALRNWRAYLSGDSVLHVQLPTLERMYGGASYFFQHPHVTNWTQRTLALARLRSGVAPTEIGVDGTVLFATASPTDRLLSYEEAAAHVDPVYPRDDVPALIAAHESARRPL